MIAPSSLHSGFTSAFVADVPVYKLPQTQPEQDKPFPHSPPQTLLCQGEQKPAALRSESQEAKGISFLLSLSFSRYQNTLWRQGL